MLIYIIVTNYKRQWIHFLACPPSIWGSTSPLNSHSIVHLPPYPLVSLTSSMICTHFWLNVWMLIQIHWSRSLFMILKEFSLRYFSVSPLCSPQYFSLDRCECFCIARAPTVNIEGFFGFLLWSSSVWIVYSLVKLSMRFFLSGSSY